MELKTPLEPVCKVSLSLVDEGKLNSVFNILADKLEKVESLLEKVGMSEQPSWIESSQARKMLCVSAKTWQNYRDERRIPFYQFGRKIYVKRSDLNSFMESHRIEARN